MAKEFNNSKRLDTFSPATGCHTTNLVPLVYLQKTGQLDESQMKDSSYSVTMAALDVKDAFLQVPQERIFRIKVGHQHFAVLKNLPGQRMGAKQWYWYFRQFATDTMQFEWSPEQPCLARRNGNIFMLHVDDLLFCGSTKFWKETFLPTMQSKFNVSFNELQEEGSSINFLRRKIVQLSDGIMVIPGTSTASIIDNFERMFGKARQQKVPCDNGIQQEDSSAELTAGDTRNYRSIVGQLLYLARDRVDIMFCVKELSGFMSKPTICSVQRLRKLVGFLKRAGVLA